MLFDSICGNENYFKVLNFNITEDDIIETKKTTQKLFYTILPQNGINRIYLYPCSLRRYTQYGITIFKCKLFYR